MFYKIPHITDINFNIITGKRSYVPFNYGNIFHNGNALLNEFIYKVYETGTDVFIHKHKVLINDNNINNFDIITNNIKKNTLDEYLQINNLNIEKNKKWLFKNLCREELFKNKIEPQRVNISKQLKNITYIYSNDIINTNILTIFKQLDNINNILIKFPTICSSITLDYIKLISFICSDCYIFKPINDSNIKDSFYILGININYHNLDIVKKYIPSNEVELYQLFNLEIDNEDLLNVFRKINNQITSLVNTTLFKFL